MDDDWEILVGGIPTPLKHMSSSVRMMTFPTEWKNKKCAKPPTSIIRFRSLDCFANLGLMWVKHGQAMS